MKILLNQYFLIAVTASHLNQIEQISRKCRLSLWTANDYKEELLREDTFNLGCIENNSKEMIGFLFARLIKKQIHSLSNNVISSLETYENNKDINHSENSKNDEHDVAEILNIAVLPEHQKRGVGQIIFNTLIDFCVINKINMIWLEVRRSNIQAQTFYLKNGFQIAYSRKKYYHSPVEDALILKLCLSFNLNSKI
jgi:ribosomal-protein-alanine acetyltransferase